MFNSIERYYENGTFSKEQVAVFVRAKWITPEQYTKITGDPYVA